MNERSAESATPPPKAEASTHAIAPTPAVPQTPSPAAKDPAQEGGVKETVESIIIAFILAFIFRGFIVEAFVIPTGSMAPTLLGAHMRFHCPDCGYRYDVNYQSESGDPEDVNIPSFAVVYRKDPSGNVVAYNRVYSIYCPNCAYKLPRVDVTDVHNDATAPPVRYGDRILVLKYVYLLSEPKRWDVVVFKSPAEPARYDYTQNYIKRLVGRPGESVFILDGDIYIGGLKTPAEQYVVQRKPRQVQDALWRIVFDNDYQPRGLGRWAQPWTIRSGDAGWETSGRRFTFDNLTGSGSLFYDHSANPDKHALTDWLAYDQINWNQAGQIDSYHVPSYTPDNTVSDVKVEFYHQQTSGGGPLQLVLTKLDHVFTATLEGDTARLEMLNRTTGQATLIGEDVRLGRAAARGRHVELENVDYRVTLRIDGRDVIQTTPQQYRPDIPALMRAAREPERLPPKPEIVITASHQQCELSHIRLWRDVYYLNRAARAADTLQRPVRWGSPHDFPENVIHLGDDEYFVLGDNSMISGDARGWSDPVHLPYEGLFVHDGRVPGRFMIGKAFFVYWPAGYRPLDRAPALVPNFGDMRFIH